MSEPRCPECHQWDMRQTHPYRPAHQPDCNRATIHDLKFWWNYEKERLAKAHKRWREQVEIAVRFHGKYRIVKHENNRLRKKLYPGKS